MKNNIFYIIIFLIFFSNPFFSENLNIQSKNILIDKNTKLTIFKNDVIAKDEKGNEYRTDYAEYDKNLKFT